MVHGLASRPATILPMTRCLFAACLCAVLPLAAAEPFADICRQQLPAAPIRVRTHVADPAISFALGAGEIQSLSGVALPGVSLGLTRVERSVERQLSFSTLRSSADGRVCARLQLDLALVLRRADIYVARELVSNECLTAAVWHHELRHFAIWQETLSSAAAELEGLLEREYEDPLLGASEHEIRARVERDLHERWMREIDALLARGDVEHELLDGRDSAGHADWCDGALARRAGW
jgi:hypothetical protein